MYCEMISALQRTEESAKQLEDQMKLAEQEARDLEQKKKEAEAEKDRVRKEVESQKEQSEAAVRNYLVLQRSSHNVTTDKEGNGDGRTCQTDGIGCREEGPRSCST